MTAEPVSAGADVPARFASHLVEVNDCLDLHLASGA